MVKVTSTIDRFPPEKVLKCPFVALHNITWQTYQALLADLGEHRASRLAYHRGTLEITMPSKLHELINRLLERIIIALTEELEMSIVALGSTRFDFAESQHGVEPDSCFYIDNAERVNPEEDEPPAEVPPDLVVEVDITSSSRSRLKIYQTMGVPEIWCYRRQTVTILQLCDREYIEREFSQNFPFLSAKKLNEFLVRGQQSNNQNRLIQEFRTWLRERDRF